jgi:uncharacterized membrane protein (UPF0127 family)/CheY-like chemotaxis protein
LASRKGRLTLRREDGRIICETVEVAGNPLTRLRGLLGRTSLPQGEGMVIRPGFSIHTAFMRFPIDVVFLDTALVVLRIEENLQPFRTASCRGAREVVELAAGECARRGLDVGDRVAWASFASLRPGSEEHGIVRSLDAPSPLRPHALVVTRDARFVKLARFLLDRAGFDHDAVTPDRLEVTLESDETVDIVLLDAEEAVVTALTAANSARAARPEVPVVIVGESRAAERAPLGVRVFDKWNETDEILLAIRELVGDADGADADLSHVEEV